MAIDVLKEFRRALRSFALGSGGTVVLGISGGPDSLAMLHLFVQTRGELGLSLNVLHVHHGIRGQEADADARFVEETCKAWAVPCRIAKVDVPALAKRNRQTLEEAARQARYSALAAEATRAGARLIAVAHNADDQAETVLMHFLRGSGMAGLRGMLPIQILPPNLEGAEDTALSMSITLIRPLLAIPRAEIEAYCREHNLSPRVDSTNVDTTIFRNRLRHQVIPLLQSLNPRLLDTLARTASIMAADDKVLQSDVDQTWAGVIREAGRDRLQFDLAAWRSSPQAIQRRLIRRAVARLRSHLRNVSYTHIEDAVRVAQQGTTGARAALPDGLVLYVDYDHINITAQEAAPARPDWPLLAQGAAIMLSAPCDVPLLDGEWRFTLTRYDGPRSGPAWDALIADPWAALLCGDAGMKNAHLRTRKPGDRFQPQGAGGTQKLNEFMINAKIPAAWREHIPLLIVGEALAWVCGWRVDQRFIVTPQTKEVWLARFEKP